MERLYKLRKRAKRKSGKKTLRTFLGRRMEADRTQMVPNESIEYGIALRVYRIIHNIDNVFYPFKLAYTVCKQKGHRLRRYTNENKTRILHLLEEKRYP